MGAARKPSAARVAPPDAALCPGPGAANPRRMACGAIVERGSSEAGGRLEVIRTHASHLHSWEPHAHLEVTRGGLLGDEHLRAVALVDAHRRHRAEALHLHAAAVDELARRDHVLKHDAGAPAAVDADGVDLPPHLPGAWRGQSVRSEHMRRAAPRSRQPPCLRCGLMRPQDLARVNGGAAAAAGRLPPPSPGPRDTRFHPLTPANPLPRQPGLFFPFPISNLDHAVVAVVDVHHVLRVGCLDHDLPVGDVVLHHPLAVLLQLHPLQRVGGVFGSGGGGCKVCGWGAGGVRAPGCSWLCRTRTARHATHARVLWSPTLRTTPWQIRGGPAHCITPRRKRCMQRARPPAPLTWAPPSPALHAPRAPLLRAARRLRGRCWARRQSGHPGFLPSCHQSPSGGPR